MAGEIEGLKSRKALVKAMECLKLFKSEFREQFTDLLDEFQFRMSIESQRSLDEMDGRLRDMMKAMENLVITFKTLETLPGMESSIAKVKERMASLSHEVHNVMNAIHNFESILKELDTTVSLL